MTDDVERLLKALANDKRLQILSLLADPVAHFPPQRDGDLVEDGVCGNWIVERLGVSQPTASEHLRVLVDAGLIRPRKIKQSTFYRRVDARIEAVPRLIAQALACAAPQNASPTEGADAP
jgi:ArsR family transcriptional regulator